MSLHGTGLIHHATTCHFSSSELRSLPELRGTMQTELDAPNFYLPSRVPVITEREAQQLETAIPTDVKRLDSISTQVLAKRQTYDVNTLFQQYRTYQQHQERTQWYMILVTSIGIAMFLGFALFLVYSRFQNLLCFFHTPSNRKTPNQNSSFPFQDAQQDASKQKDTNAEREAT